MKASKVEWKVETYTNGAGETVTCYVGDTNVKLVSVAKNPITRATGKQWYPATGSWVDQKGESQQPRLIINGGNYDYGMETGVEYRTRIVFIPETKSTLMIMSHLAMGAEASEDWFDFSGIEVALDLEKEATGKAK